MRSEAELVVADLVSAGLVEGARTAEAEAVVARRLGVRGAPPVPRPGTRARLAEVAGYAGGALVVAAVLLFLAQSWSDLSEGAQVAVLAGVGVVLGAAAVVVVHVGGGRAELPGDDARRRLGSALWTAGALSLGLAAGLQTSLLVSLEHESAAAVVGAVVVLAVTAAGYAVAPSALALAAMAVAGVVAIVSGLSLLPAEDPSTLWPGLLVLLYAAAWLAVTEAGLLHARTVGRCLGVAMALFGAQLPVFDGGAALAAYLLLAGVAIAGFVLYLRTVGWPYLVAGVAAITLVVPEAVIDWTDGSLGVAGGVLVAGLTLLAAALAGLRVRREALD